MRSGEAVSHLTHNQEIGSSNLSSATKMKNQELNQNQKAYIERQALQQLLQSGVHFAVRLKHLKVKEEPKWRKLLGKNRKPWRDSQLTKGWSIETKTDDSGNKYYQRVLTISPLFLGTIDQIRMLYLPIESKIKRSGIDDVEEYIQNLQFVGILADIIAVSLLNKPTSTNTYDKERRSLKKFLMDNMTVFEMEDVVEAISNMMNVGGFTHAIGLLKNLDTTSPIAKSERAKH